MIDKQAKRPYVCQCRHCVEQPSGPTAEWHRQINQWVVRLNEKHRRQFVGLLAQQLGRGGVSLPTLSRLLRRRDYSLRVTHKRLAGKQSPHRDQQFSYLVRWRQAYLRRQWSVISVDAKKAS